MPLFGKNATTYYSSVLFSGSNVPTDLTWADVTAIQDESDAFGAVWADVTTRAQALTGIAAEANVLNAVSITFSYIKEPTDTTFAAIWTALQTPGTPIALLFLSGPKTTTTSLGCAANWTFELNWEKQLRDKQVQNFTAKPLQYFSWVTGAVDL